MLSSELWATLAIGVGGGVGLAAIFVPPALERRKSLNSEVLEPAFNQILESSKRSAWEGGVEPIRSKFEPAQWLRIPAKFRGPLDELSNLTALYLTDYGSYLEYMRRIGWFESPVRNALSKYVTSDASLVRTDELGLEGGGMPQVQIVAAGLAPYVLLNPEDPKVAWMELHSATGGYSYWANTIVRQLERGDPEALKTIFRGMCIEPGFERACELASSANAAHELMLTQSTAVLSLLTKRLGLGAA